MGDKADAIGEPVTELDEFWLQTARDAIKESISSLEEAAKQLISAVTTGRRHLLCGSILQRPVKGHGCAGHGCLAARPSVRQPHRHLADLSLLCCAGLHSRDLQDQPQLARAGGGRLQGDGGLQAPQSEKGLLGTDDRVCDDDSRCGVLPEIRVIGRDKNRNASEDR